MKKKIDSDVNAAQTKVMEGGEEGQMGVTVRDCGRVQFEMFLRSVPIFSVS